MSEFLCDLKPSVGAPDYVKTNPVVNVSSLMTDMDQLDLLNVLDEWPASPTLFDSSQWIALRQILGKKLAIVQGPPGTGKTYVSVIALRIMLSNMQASDPPIIVAAQTNHALDQLLRNISPYEGDYIRLGGQSSDEDIKKRTLFELRRRNKAQIPEGSMLRPARKQLKAITDKLANLLESFTPDSWNSPLSADLLLDLSLITQAQYDSLLKGAEGWVRSGAEIDPMSAWLGDTLKKFEVKYKAENFGFAEEEMDLEYEQLKELEAEQGGDDGDFESLKGRYFSLKESFTTTTKSSQLVEKSIPERFLKQRDLWKIPTRDRGATYHFLQMRTKAIIRDNFRSILKEYNKACEDYKTGKWERDASMLESAKIIGMTTTGLSKYRALISSIQPKIVMVEEAAEVIEAPVAAACVNSLQHLILVGDHQQLQGHCSLTDLEGEPFYLNISMFERLIHNGLDYKRLSRQRRMAPEIRRILAPIYHNLQDNSCVLDRPKVPGMGDVSSFFFCHSWPEASDSLLSKCNDKECKMLVGLYVYLHMNGVPIKDITVLTFYNGQRKKILKALKETSILQGQYTKVVTVDSYQGEENEIVLLSLVRSNEYGNIGFLAVDNRVCVALSRAKRGFYIFGDAESLAVSSALWWDVVQIMSKNPKRIGYHVPLRCVNHGNETFVRG